MSLVSACGITPMQLRASSGSFATSKPLMSARPLVMGSSVVIMRISVDLPAPFGPSRPKISPCCTLNEMSSTAVKSPYFLVMWSTTMASPVNGRCQASRLRACGCEPAHRALRRQVFRQQHLGGHAGDQRAVGVVDLQLQADGLDVALAAADVALGGEVALHRLEDHGAFDGLARGQAHLQLVADRR